MFHSLNYFKFTTCLLLISTLSLSFAAEFTTSENRTISYTDIGEGKSIVLIHAFPTDQQLWLPQQKELKKHFRVITLDLWGFGSSSAVDGHAITMTQYADEVKQLLEHLNIEQAIVGGESMGGYIALAFLQKYPGSLNGLILSDTQAIPDTDEAKLKREAAARDILEHGTSSFINGFMTKALSSDASDETRYALKNILEMQSATALASALRGMAMRDNLSEVLAETKLPVLILTGDQDVLISPQQSQAMHVLAKNSKLVIISHAGHLSNLEQADEWNNAVLDYFSTH